MLLKASLVLLVLWLVGVLVAYDFGKPIHVLLLVGLMLFLLAVLKDHARAVREAAAPSRKE